MSETESKLDANANGIYQTNQLYQSNPIIQQTLSNKNTN